jgi:hypothetical protein
MISINPSQHLRSGISLNPSVPGLAVAFRFFAHLSDPSYSSDIAFHPLAPSGNHGAVVSQKDCFEKILHSWTERYGTDTGSP